MQGTLSASGMRVADNLLDLALSTTHALSQADDSDDGSILCCPKYIASVLALRGY